MSFMESLSRTMGYVSGTSSWESPSMMGGAMMVGSSFGLGDYASQLSLGGDTYMTGFSNPFGGAFADFFRGFGRPSSFGGFMGGDAMSTYRAALQDSWRLQPPAMLGMAGGAAGQAGGAGGAGQTGGAGSTTNTEATTETTENKPIPEATITAAITGLQEKGYSEEEAREIVSRIEGVVDGDQAKFSSILAKVPAKATGENADTPNADWVEQFGQWYARYIKGMSADQAEDYVHSTAFDAQSVFEYPDGSLTGVPYVTFNANPQSVQADVNGDGQMEDAKKYTVKADSGTGLVAGTEIYLAGGKYYQKVGDRYEEIPFRKSGSKYHVRVGETPNDHLTVHAAGRTETGPDGKIYDVYNVEAGSPVGPTATAISATELYRLDGKWYTKNDDGTFQEIAEQPGSFENGVLNFGGEADYRLRGGFDTSMDARDYMQLLDDGASAVHDASSQLDTEATSQREARVATVQDGLEDIFGTNMQISVSEQGKTLELTYTAANAQAISDLLSADNNAKFTQFQQLLSQLPAGTRVLLNGRPVISSDRATWILNEIKKDVPQKLSMSNALDLRDVASVQEIKDKLRAEIDRQRTSQGIRNPQEMSFGLVMLPDDEELALDEATLQTLMSDLARETTYQGTGVATAAFALYGDDATAPVEIIVVAKEHPDVTDEAFIATVRAFLKEQYAGRITNIDDVPITIVRATSTPAVAEGSQASGTAPATQGGSSSDGQGSSSGSGAGSGQAGTGEGDTGQGSADEGSASAGAVTGSQPIAGSQPPATATVAAPADADSGPFVIEGEVPTTPEVLDSSPYFAATAPGTIPDPIAMFDSAMAMYGTPHSESSTTVSKQLDLASVPSTSPQVLASQIRINAGVLPSGTERVLITARVPEEDFAAAHTAMEDVIDILEDTYYPGVDVDLHFIMA